MVKNRLICTANEDLISINDRNILMGEWCLTDKIFKKKIMNLNFGICEYHYMNNQNKVIKDWNYLFTLYDKVMNALSIKLNEYHKENFSRRYWEILAGQTLVHLLSILWDRWETIKSAEKKFNINEVAILKYNSSDYIPKDFNDLLSNKYDDHFWNNCVYSEIIKDSFKIKIVEVDHKKKKDFNFSKKLKNNNFNFYSLIDTFLSKIIKEKVLLYKFGGKKTFSYMIKQFELSRFYNEFRNQITFKNKLDRKNLFLDLDPKNLFEEMLSRKLLNFLPISHLEGFRDINLYLAKIKPEPKYVITTYGHVFDDLFKIWTASKVEKKISKFIICSHGGFVENSICFDSWLNISDKFITWENKKHLKCLQLPPQYSLNFKQIKKFNNKKILFCTANASLYLHRIQDYILGSQIKLYLNFWKKFISKLNINMKKNIVVRQIPNSDPWFQKKEFEEILGKKAISKKKKFMDEVKDSKIIINTALQTTFFESMLSGVPTIVLLKNDLWNLSEEGKEIYDLLIENKIIFKNDDNLINHLNEIDANPLSWWNSSDLISVRNKFHDYFCNFKNEKKWNNFFASLN